MLRGLDRQFLRGFVRSTRGAPLVVILDAERVLSSGDRLALDHMQPEGSAHV